MIQVGWDHSFYCGSSIFLKIVNKIFVSNCLICCSESQWVPVDIERIRITESVIRILMQKKTTSCELRHLLVSCIMTYSWNWHSFSTDHAREKTMSCELRQLLEIIKHYKIWRIIFTIITKLFARPVDNNLSQGVTDLFKFKVPHIMRHLKDSSKRFRWRNPPRNFNPPFQTLMYFSCWWNKTHSWMLLSRLRILQVFVEMVAGSHLKTLERPLEAACVKVGKSVVALGPYSSTQEIRAPRALRKYEPHVHSGICNQRLQIS